MDGLAYRSLRATLGTTLGVTLGPALGVTLGAALALGGCTKSQSEDILTHGMSAGISARAEGNGSTKVTTELFVGDPIGLDFVELSSGDKIVVTHAGQGMTATKSELLNIVSYVATFSTDADGEQFEVALDREADAGAPRSVVTLPAPFTLGTIPATASRASALTVTWSPGGKPDTMAVTVDGTCIDTAVATVSGDPGTATFAAGAIHKKVGSVGETMPDMCQATLHVERSRGGTLDPGYGKGGTIVGVQARTATFMTAP